MVASKRTPVLARNPPGAKQAHVKCENLILAEICQLRTRFGNNAVRVKASCFPATCEVELDISGGLVLSSAFPEGYPAKMPKVELLDKGGNFDVQIFQYLHQSMTSFCAEAFGNFQKRAQESPLLLLAERMSNMLQNMPMNSKVQQSTVCSQGIPVQQQTMVAFMMTPVFLNLPVNSSNLCPELQHDQCSYDSYNDQVENCNLHDPGNYDINSYKAQFQKDQLPVPRADRTTRGQGSQSKSGTKDKLLESRRRYDISQKKIKSGEDTRTTVMIRKIPKDRPKEGMVDFLEQCGLNGKYSFFYMPLDRHNKAHNVGIAFVNFKSSQDILKLCDVIHGHRERLSVSYSRLQGNAQLMEHFARSAVMQDMTHRPVFCPDLRESAEDNPQEA
mmetsp:Transcript_44638/g.80266  ORF Transcript_44638/g.80266 Transcript_44638/m.80266 type:complete len:388 (+) Transcript_44638:34-1197(+)